MTNGKKRIDEFLEQKLSRSSLVQTKDDFQKILMQKIVTEHKKLVDENRKEKIVKYALGSFSTFMIGFTIVLGYITSKSESVSSGTNVAVERSNTLVGRLVYAVQSVFIEVLNFFGVSISPTTLTVALIIVLVVGVFLMGERLFLRGKYKSGINIIKRG